jgi:hypothetical protein
MALRLLPPAVSPSPAPVCPSPATIKGRGAPPGHHHTHPTLNCSLLSPQRPPHRAPPPPIVPHRRPVMSDPPPPPLAAGEAHRRPPLPFPSTVVRFHARGRRSGRSPASLLQDGDRGPPWTDAARGPRTRGLGPRVSFRKIIPGNSNF